jgi:tRNA dimethylallyltransferase
MIAIGRPEREPGRHLVLVGPTAADKSAVALAIARQHQAEGDQVEIVSTDSMQVYRGMDIGTAKATAAEQSEVPHHLIDLVEPHEEFSVAEFARRADAALDDIEGRGARALLVGGTGLYVQAVVDRLRVPGRYPTVLAELEEESDTERLHERLRSLDPLAASRIEPGNRRRVLRALEVTLGSGTPFSGFGPGLDAYPDTPFVLCGLRIDRPELARRIAERYRTQMAEGFLEEVRVLARRPGGLSRTAAQALGYRELLEHLEGRVPLQEALELAETRTRQFAVRQIRWFRRDPRICWFDHDGSPGETALGVDRLWRNRMAERRGSGTTVGRDHAPRTAGRP